MKQHYLITICFVVATVRSVPRTATQQPGYTQLSQQQIKQLQENGFSPTVNGYRSTAAYREVEYDEEYDNEPESSQDRTPTYANQNYPIPLKTTAQPNYPIPVRTSPGKGYSPTPKSVRLQQQGLVRRGESDIEGGNKLEEEKEEEEPDRLSILLPNSRFNCNGKNTGYYADQELGCEVFHYCQENIKHSWICPEGFTFHQVHLICMPPGGDNICEKSADYHFVNDFLYKPLNLDEYQQKPNITLKYSDRYYPENYRPRYDDDEEAPAHHQHSVRVTSQPRAHPVSPTTLRPQTFRPQSQVFRSAEEINIPLQQRRPIPQYTNEY